MKNLQLSRPHLLVMVGIVGSGKTTFANKFADTFQAPIINNTKISNVVSELDNYNNKADKIIKDLLYIQLDQLLKTNCTIVADIDSHTRSDRMALTAKAKEYGYETIFIWAQIDQLTAKQRSMNLKSKNSISADQFDRLIKNFTAPSNNENTLVISGKHTYASQAKVVLRRLSASRTENAKKQSVPERISPSLNSRHSINIT